MATVRKGRDCVGMGFIAARTRTSSPSLIPPSTPPARFVLRWNGRQTFPSRGLPRLLPGNISSWTRLPGRVESAIPPPISTPLIAGMLITAKARRASSLLSQETNDPSPGGTPFGIGHPELAPVGAHRALPLSLGTLGHAHLPDGEDVPRDGDPHGAKEQARQ